MIDNSCSWITGTDLIAAAFKTTKNIKSPLELPFLSFLIQLLFQTAGERETLNNKSSNNDLTRLVDRLFQHVKLNDPSEGEGKPIIVVTLAVERVTEPK